MPKYLAGMLTESAPKEMAEHTLSLMSDIRPEASLTMLRAMAEADLRDILPTIDVPTLVLHGDLDARAPLSVGRELHERIRGSKLVVLPGVGHLSNVEAAEAFNREVRSFVRAVSTTLAPTPELGSVRPPVHRRLRCLRSRLTQPNSPPSLGGTDLIDGCWAPESRRG